MENNNMLGICLDNGKVCVEKFITITTIVGDGSDDNPCREIKKIFNMDGKLITEYTVGSVDDCGDSLIIARFSSLI